MAQKVIRFGVIGCGLMGREFASAAGRWHHLLNLDFKPVIVAACDLNRPAREWFADNLSTVDLVTDDYQALLGDPRIDAIYCAVPHNQHQALFSSILRAGKHLLGEKPFGIDQPANQQILQAVSENPGVLARCSSEFPFFPGAYRIIQMIREGRFGQIIEVEAGFWHSSDLDPEKPINWKRMVDCNGEYGCMGDLGMHVVHLPFRAGWIPLNVRALLSKVVKTRPDKSGARVPCETWDNAILATEVAQGDRRFPMTLSFKRIAPGNNNTWFLRVYGTALSAEFSTQYPKHLRLLPYTPGGPQEWHLIETPYRSAYDAITGGIFEFGFSDAILQMWAAFCDEVAHGREGMRQPVYCATPEETALSHCLFTAALESNRKESTEKL